MTGNDKTGVGRHLRGLREQTGLTQTETAARAGLTREAVCLIEAGRHDPKMSTIRRYCDAIGARVYIGLPGQGAEPEQNRQTPDAGYHPIMADHQRPGDTTRKGYGAQHQRLRASLAPRVATGTVACARCGYLIAPGEPWDLGHKDGTGKREYAGPEHRTCNRAAGAAVREAARTADPEPRPMTRW